MERVMRIVVAIAAGMIFAQLSQEFSTPGKEKPRINFFGTITLKSGKSLAIQNITIDGTYKQIVMFEAPEHTDMIPNHKVKIDLSEEQAIHVPYKGEHPIVTEYKKRPYITIEVISNNGKTKSSYIVDRNTKVYFDEVLTDDETNVREHETTFEGIDTITIDGYEQRKEPNNRRVSNYSRNKSFQII